MRDISAGGDIVNTTITEVVGNNPSVEILQQPAEELAKAEKLSRRIVSSGRKKRSIRGAIYAGVAIVALAAAGILGYFWLFQGGTIAPADIIRDGSNVALGAIISTIVSALIGTIFGVAAFWQKDPTSAEQINTERLKTIGTRWEELRLLGLPKAEIKRLRKRS